MLSLLMFIVDIPSVELPHLIYVLLSFTNVVKFYACNFVSQMQGEPLM